MIGADALIPAELLAELASSATVRPVVHPADAAPENRYTPSQIGGLCPLPGFDLPVPGRDRPAVDCDVDHTIAYGDGGPTHASNLKCLCRLQPRCKTVGTNR